MLFLVFRSLYATDGERVWEVLILETAKRGSQAHLVGGAPKSCIYNNERLEVRTKVVVEYRYEVVAE